MEMAEWRNGGMAEWRNGGMPEWQIVMDNGPSYSSKIELEEWQKRRAARSSCAVLGPCFVNRKKVQSFTNGGNGGMAERMAEWQNGRNGYIRTIYGTRRQHSNLLYYRYHQYCTILHTYSITNDITNDL